MFVVFIFIIQAILVSVAAAATRIMPLGDSITKGSNSGATPDDEDHFVAYRKALWDKLIAAGYDVGFVGSQTAGGAVSDFDPNHEGHGGWTADEIVNGNGITEEGKLGEWLADYQPDIVLLHIGTNGLSPNPNDVETILNVIDSYSPDTWVVLALIVNRACCIEEPQCPTDCQDTSDFNDNVYDMALDRSGDKIKIVDMEIGAGIDYHFSPTGDMFDGGNGGYHPYETGYAKMATEWFSALQEILPDPDPDPDPDPPNNSSSSDSGCFIGIITE